MPPVAGGAGMLGTELGTELPWTGAGFDGITGGVGVVSTGATGAVVAAPALVGIFSFLPALIAVVVRPLAASMALTVV